MDHVYEPGGGKGEGRAVRINCWGWLPAARLGVTRDGHMATQPWWSLTTPSSLRGLFLSQKAFKERNRQYLGQRYIELTLC